MTDAFLNEGATSVAAVNWSDATGFADNAALVINKPFGGGIPLTGAVDQSALTDGIHSLDLRPGAIGTLGSASSPLRCDIDDESAPAAGDAASAFLAAYGTSCVVYYEAAGNASVARNISVGTGNQVNLQGGTATNVGVVGGRFNANESAIVTNFDQYSGRSQFDEHATPIALLRVTGGTVIVNRLVTAMHISGNARVIYAPPATANMAGTSITLNSGILTQIRGATPTILALGGTLDFSQLDRPTVPGGTSWLVGGARVVGSVMLDDSNIEMIYSAKRDVGAPIQIA